MLLRRLRTAPLFTLFSIATLAVGLAIATAAYSFIYSVLRLDSHVRDPSTLVLLSQNQVLLRGASEFSWPEVADVAGMQTMFDDMGAWTTFATAVGGAATESRLVAGEAVSGTMFRVAGVRAAIGRVVLPNDDRPDAAPVVVLSDTIWRKQFGADPSVIGTSIRMAGRVFEVIGVASGGFHGFAKFGTSASVWTPIASSPAPEQAGRVFRILGRLKPGRTLDEVKAEARAIAGRLDGIAPLSTAPGSARAVSASLAYSNQRLFDDFRAGALFILALPALVLLVACTNLANLVLSRGTSRQHEFAVRRALGASRWRLVREQLLEGAAIAIAGGILGVIGATRLLIFVSSTADRVLGALPEMQVDVRLEPIVLVAAAALACLALIVSSLVPALQLTRRSDRRTLSADAVIGTTPTWRGRSNLIALQVTVSVGLFLMTAFGVTVLTFEMPRDAPTNLDRIAVVGVPFGRQQFDESRVRRVIDRVLEDARALPDVERAEVATLAVGMDRGRSRGAFLASDLHPFGPGTLTGSLVEVIAATPGIFQMFGTTIRSGRGFTARDDAAAPHVAVINRALAIELFGAEDAQGRELLMRPNASAAQIERITVIGVVGDTVGASGRVSNEFYVPFAQHFSPDVAILAKTRSGDVDPVITKIRTTLRQIDPDVAVSQSGRADLMTARYGAGILRMVIRGAAALAIIALVLAMTGLYGVLSHVVSQRVRELGLRMALGADQRRIVIMILKDGFRPVVEGLFIGLAVAAIFRTLMPSSLEVAIGPADLIAFAFAAGPLLVAGAIACYFPAHRAASVDPNVALRNL